VIIPAQSAARSLQHDRARRHWRAGVRRHPWHLPQTIPTPMMWG